MQLNNTEYRRDTVHLQYCNFNNIPRRYQRMHLTRFFADKVLFDVPEVLFKYNTTKALQLTRYHSAQKRTHRKHVKIHIHICLCSLLWHAHCTHVDSHSLHLCLPVLRCIRINWTLLELKLVVAHVAHMVQSGREYTTHTHSIVKL